MRKLLNEDPEKNTQLLKESCKLAITLMKGIFSRLELKDLESCDAIEDDIESDFLSGLNLLQPDVAYLSHENIRNPLGFLMFSGGIDKQQ